MVKRPKRHKYKKINLQKNIDSTIEQTAKQTLIKRNCWDHHIELCVSQAYFEFALELPAF